MAARTNIWCAAVGLAGGTLWGLLSPDITLLQTHYWRVGILISATVWAVALVLDWGVDNRHSRLLFALSLAGVAGAVTAYLWYLLPPSEAEYFGDEHRLVTWGLLGIPAYLAAFSLGQTIYVGRGIILGQYRQHHHRWFDYLFGNIVRIAVGIVFTIAVILVYWLWTELLELIQLPGLATVVREDPVPQMVAGTAFGYGLTLVQHRRALVTVLQEISAQGAKIVLPVLSVAGLVLLLSLPFIGLEPLWQTGHAAAILLVLALLLILVTNLVRGGSADTAPYPRWLRYLVEAALVAMPVIAVLAMYAVVLRVEQYGWTPQRLWGIAFGCMTAAYGIGLGISVWLRREDWLGLLSQVNLVLAVLAIPIAVVMHTPWLDPIRLSVTMQSERLLSGRVTLEEFDIDNLRRHLGQVGWMKYTELANLQDHPRDAEIRDWFAAYQAATSAGRPWPPSTATITRSDIEVLQPGRELPDELLVALQADVAWFMICREESQYCAAMVADIIAGGEEEYCIMVGGPSVVNPSDSRCYTQDNADGHWREFGRIISGEPIKRSDLAAALQQGTLPLAEPRQFWRPRIGSRVFEVVPCCNDASDD